MQDDESLAITLQEPGLAACYAAVAQGVCITGERAGQPALRLEIPDRIERGSAHPICAGRIAGLGCVYLLCLTLSVQRL